MRRLVILTCVAATSSSAMADRYEATIAVRPSGALALVNEEGAKSAAQVVGGGGTIGFAYGVRNWLDLGAELGGWALAQAEYADATVNVTGTPKTGVVTRTSRLAQLRGGATFRFGVGWVPTVYVGVAVGARLRGAATLVRDAQGPIGITPDDGASSVTLEVAPVARLGLSHRVDRRWSVGLSVGATYGVGIGAPALTLLDATLELAYSWYPLW